MKKNTEIIFHIMQKVFPHRPEPDKCLDENTLRAMFEKSRKNLTGQELKCYDESVSHMSQCRSCALAYKKICLDDPNYLLAIGKNAMLEVDRYRDLQQVDLTITYVRNSENGRQELHVEYFSPADFLPHEHEEMHRKIIAKLLDQGIITPDNIEDISITRGVLHELELNVEQTEIKKSFLKIEGNKD